MVEVLKVEGLLGILLLLPLLSSESSDGMEGRRGGGVVEQDCLLREGVGWAGGYPRGS